MAADLHIHVGEMPIRPATSQAALMLNGPFELDYEKWDGNPEATVWIGEVSWLKAALFDDAPNYIPPLVAAVAETFPEISSGKSVEITNGLIGLLKERIAEAAVVEDETSYSIADPEAILIWLGGRKGQRAWQMPH